MTLPEAITYLLDEFHLGDQVYTVKDRAGESGESFEGNMWDHPMVNKFSEALKALQTFRAENQGKEIQQ